MPSWVCENAGNGVQDAAEGKVEHAQLCDRPLRSHLSTGSVWSLASWLRHCGKLTNQATEGIAAYAQTVMADESTYALDFETRAAPCAPSEVVLNRNLQCR